jgi:thiamine biosynthesis protein ThiC
MLLNHYAKKENTPEMEFIAIRKYDRRICSEVARGRVIIRKYQSSRNRTNDYWSEFPCQN